MNALADELLLLLLLLLLLAAMLLYAHTIAYSNLMMQIHGTHHRATHYLRTNYSFSISRCYGIVREHARG